MELPAYVYDKDELKMKLSIAYAASELGTVFDGSGFALCPFHDDKENPNLELMAPGEDGVPWYFCRACGEAGDVIKFIQKVKDVSFPSALIIGSQLYENQPTRFELAIPKKRTTYEVTPEWEAQLELYTKRAEEHKQIGLLSFSYGFTTEDTPVNERHAWDQHLLNWQWCLDPLCQVVIPHRDATGALCAVKVRYRNGDWKTYGKLDNLYGSWIKRERDDSGRSAAILCEGESDTVWTDFNITSDVLQWAHYSLGTSNIDVLGLPSGASSFQSAWIDQLAMYDVIFFGLDNDDAGNRAMPRWENALGDKDLRRIMLPWKHDMRESGQTVDVLLEHATLLGASGEAQRLDEEFGTVIAE